MEFHSETSSCPAAQADKKGRAPLPERAPPMHRFNLLRNLGQQQPPQLFPQPLFEPQPQQKMMIRIRMIHRQPPPPQLLLQHPILKYPLKMKI